ncbi:MAG TPA: monovalent cation/H(+) antiporter subunit G [Thermomicrobiales bacterium]|nr:monovalent cation/H(+) antiporter subunit G [Thermomicrobiales bacterium]
MTLNFDALAPWIADALVLLGVTVMTIGMYGIYRMPDLYTRLHAASKSAFLGVISLVVASMFAGQPAITERAILIGVFLLLTTPVSAHVIARAAYLDGQRDEATEAVGNEPNGAARPVRSPMPD